MFKMPKVKAYENGTFELVEANGWEIEYPKNLKHIPGLTTVMYHDETQAELVIILSTLEHGESLYVILALPTDRKYHDEVDIADHVDDSDEGSSEIEDVLAYTVNQGLENIQKAYDEDYENT